MAIVLLLPFVYFAGEFEFLKKSYFLGNFDFWALMTVTGVTGFLINVAMFLQIKYTSPLTNTISGTAKACVQTILAWAIYQNIITAMVGTLSHREC